jgi:hypothetical protein
MPTVVIDATGNLRAINTAFSYLAHGGRYVLVGLQKDDISVSHPEFHKREATLMSSRNATRADFELVIASLKTGMVTLQRISRTALASIRWVTNLPAGSIPLTVLSKQWSQWHRSTTQPLGLFMPTKLPGTVPDAIRHE